MEIRFKQHGYQVRRGNMDTVLYQHFAMHGVNNMGIEGLESHKEWTKTLRQKAERTWIHFLKTFDPLGLTLPPSPPAPPLTTSTDPNPAKIIIPLVTTFSHRTRPLQNKNIQAKRHYSPTHISPTQTQQDHFSI